LGRRLAEAVTPLVIAKDGWLGRAQIAIAALGDSAWAFYNTGNDQSLIWC
jgi:hypothetical protein